MKLPNAEYAIVEMPKLLDYCLNTTHFRGRNKARVFQSALGLSVDDAIELKLALEQAAREQDALGGSYRLVRNSIHNGFRDDSKWPHCDNQKFVDCSSGKFSPETAHLLHSLRKVFMQKLENLSVVALLQDLPEKGLVRGQIGTVVEVYSPTVGEIEFCDQEGRTYALVTLASDLLMRLHDRPLDQVA
jgi:Domain of unknown function (DUF4926)